VESHKAYLFIVNPRSGTRLGHGAEQIISIIENKIKLAGHQVTCVTTRHGGHATELVKEAVASSNRWTAIVAVGGDGTVNEVARGLLHSGTPLGIIPLGSGNGLARHLGIPLTVSGALSCILNGETLRMDSAEINGYPFFCTAGLGFDALVSHRFSQHSKRGLLSYAKISWDAYWAYRPFSFTRDHKKELAFSVCFANAGQFGNNAWIAPHANVTDGKLDLCHIKPFPKWMGVAYVWKMFTKRLTHSKYIAYERFTEATIQTETPSIVHFDGEPHQLISTEIRVRIIPQSLTVIH
jgi:diacylglycerol kinase (ATP)